MMPVIGKRSNKVAKALKYLPFALAIFFSPKILLCTNNGDIIYKYEKVNFKFIYVFTIKPNHI
jgi:hypothetical protein